jgi:hypothetical protein
MKKLLTLLALLLTDAHVSAGFVLGPGPVTVTNGDGLSSPLITVDLNAPVTLSAGDYVVSQFNYRFSLYDGFITIGDITPIVFTGNGVDDFTPIAIGDTITYSGPTAFISTPFGGSDTFTLGATTTIYAGLYWTAPAYTGGPEYRMPIGSNNNGGLIFNRQSGVDSPVIGSPISGGDPLPAGFNSRRYDFSIGVDSAVTAVPEPPSFLLALPCVGLLGWCLWRRKPLGLGHLS